MDTIISEDGRQQGQRSFTAEKHINKKKQQ